jgi:hypothetical protein
VPGRSHNDGIETVFVLKIKGGRVPPLAFSEKGDGRKMVWLSQIPAVEQWLETLLSLELTIQQDN